MEVKKILVPVDFKAEPGVVFEFISKIGISHPQLEITLLNVVEFPIMPGEYNSPIQYMGEFYQQHLKQVNEYMKKMAASSWFNNMNLKTEILIDSMIGPGEEIAKYAEQGNFDLVLLYSRHRKGMQNLFSGSELLRIERLCNVPMIILSPERLPRFNRIAFATDFSKESTEIYHVLKPIAEFLGGRILCFNVNTPNEFRDHRKYISDRNSFLNSIGTAEGVDIAIYNAQDINTGIIQFAEDNVANFLALGTHARKGISRIYFGSITEEIIKSTTYPLIVLNVNSATYAKKKAESKLAM